MFRSNFARWFQLKHGEPKGDVTLERSRIFILPTRSGLVFTGVAITVWFGSLNFNLQLGYLLAFLVLGIGLVSMYQTHRNMLNLTLRAQRASSVHAGEAIDFDFVVDNAYQEPRYAVRFSFILPRRRRSQERNAVEQPLHGMWADVAPFSTARVRIGLPTRRRGRRNCPRVHISTRFPFGFWEAWAYASPHLSAIVYPAPEADSPPLPLGGYGDHTRSTGVVAGTDDFAGVRPYVPGDPLKRVAWRLAARSDELSVKLFESSAGEETVLDFDALPLAMPLEKRIARLTRWVLMAEANGLRYCLRLPGCHMDTDVGPAHRTRCLEALALFPEA